MALRVTRNLYHSTAPSDTIYSYDEEPAFDSYAYKQKLEELLKYNTKKNIFYDIDTLFIKYGSLKRKHSTLWKTHESYTKRISSFLKSEHAGATISTSIQDISRVLQELNHLETDFTQWLYKLFNTLCDVLQTQHNKTDHKDKEASIVSAPTSEEETPIKLMIKQKTAPINNQPDETAPKTNNKSSELMALSRQKTYSDTSSNNNIINYTENNIKPSHTKTLSISGTLPQIQKRKSKKGKKKRKRKRKDSEALIYNTVLVPSPSSKSEGSLDIKGFQSLNSVCSLPFKSLSADNSLSTPKRTSIERSFGEIYEKGFVDCTAENYGKRLELIDEGKQNKESIYKASNKQLRMLRYYASQIFGRTEEFDSPFGSRPVLYCDWIGSGKSLRCIEHYLMSEMMTLYANTHDSITISGIQSSTYQQEARSIILESVQGQSDQDVVLFCGNSAVDSVYKMANVLQQSFIDSGEEYKRDTFVVFVSICESDNNVFIWKEMGCKIVLIPEYDQSDDTHKGLDMNVLETQLKFYSSIEQKDQYKLLIGSFTAANAITGVVPPIDDITELLHKYGALAFWDYEVGGPSMDILMTSYNNPAASKDAIFISPHRYLGGPGTPGILCAKKELFGNLVPVVPGNGSLFISYGFEDTEYEYLANIEEREESGTSNLIGIVRASLCFMIKDYLSTKFIEHTEIVHLDTFLSELQSIPNLVILGDTETDRLPIISMMITHSTKYLHYNFVAALLNDLFGIQGRGGMFNCGMYAMHCLGITEDEMLDSTQQIKDNNNELERRGFYRINLHYTLNKQELMYIVNAIKYVCEKGWRFLPLYDIDPSSGSFYYRDKSKALKEQLRSLMDISFDEETGKMLWNGKSLVNNKKHYRMNGKSFKNNFDKYFKMADDILLNSQQSLSSYCDERFKNEANINNDSWYWLPSELYEDCVAQYK